IVALESWEEPRLFAPKVAKPQGKAGEASIVGRVPYPSLLAGYRLPIPALALPTTAAPPQISRKCSACEDEDKKALQRKPAQPEGPIGGAPSIVHEVLRSAGQPLEPATRAFMAARAGHDFARVRVHTDALASTSARAVGARAYTVGRHIVFGAGQF